MGRKKYRDIIAISVVVVMICFLVLIVITITKDSDNGKDNTLKESVASIEAMASSESVESSESYESAVSSEITESVLESKPEPIHISVEKLTLNKYSVSVEQGKKDMPLVTMHPQNATDKSEIWTSDNNAVATVNKYGNITGVSPGNCTVTVRSVDNQNVYAEVKVTVTPYVPPVKVELKYINGILIANKTYALPYDYNPGVNPEANSALQKMFAAAKTDGLNLFVKSGFRSYNTQKSLYNKYVARDGKAAADRYSARPGHSEHQTGLGFDINSASPSFEGTPEAKWLAENCYKYGFIIRYPKGKESVTGYMYEPWHIRYLGIDTATAVYQSGLALEEYLGITSVYS